MRLIDADELKEAMEEHTDYKGYLVCAPEEVIDLAPTVERPQWIPFKAMEAVKRYCEKNTTCNGCPMYYSKKYGYCSCMHRPEHWEIKKEGKTE